MKIRIGFDITLRRLGPTPLILALLPRPEQERRIEAGPFVITPHIPARPWSDPFGNRRLRAPAAEGLVRLQWEGVAQDDGLPDAVDPLARATPIDDLPQEALQFLAPSRYCESDTLTAEAWSRFGQTEPGWSQVRAVSDFVHGHIRFGYEHADPTKSAADVLKDGRGVCRDFAHLTVAFCRALSIPARYVSGYMGDIGVPYDGPGDFCAWAEVYVGGLWRTVDARHNKPRIGRVPMVHGRDAADVPMITSFGDTVLENFEVFSDEIAEAGPGRPGADVAG